MKKKLQLGILGTGLAAHELYLPALREAQSRIALVACANRTASKAVSFARLAGAARVVPSAQELFQLPEVDAVLISLPIADQPRFILQALEAGKPVLSEKPIARDVASGRRLLRTARRFDVPWLVGENFEFLPAARRLARWLSEGRVGDIRLVEVHQVSIMNRSNPYFRTPWRLTPKHVGGFISDGGVHLAHVLRRCVGQPRVVRSFATQFDPNLPPVDTVVAALSFPCGALGTWTSCFCASYEGPELRIYGSRANAELTGNEARLIPRRGRPLRFVGKANSFAAQFRHFADVVQNRVSPAVSPDDALEDLELIQSLLA